MRNAWRNRALQTLLVAWSLALAGCATQNPHDRSAGIETPLQWQTALPHNGSGAGLSDWWSRFDDPALSKLIATAEARSPGLVQAWAAITRARSTVTSTQADALPAVNGGASWSRARQQSQTGAVATSNTRSAGLDASWEIDLFGKVRSNTDAAKARVDARSDDWHSARVSLAAEVADTYVQYRACRLLAQAYTEEETSNQKTLQSTQVSVKAGLTAPADGALAVAALASTQSSLEAQKAQCDVLVKSLVALTSMPEPELRELLGSGTQELPRTDGFNVGAVPAQALQQRPDVASLEREAAAAGAEVGAAKADLHPSLSLSGSISVSATSVASALTTWSFGPTLSLPLFDGGKRRAAVDSAWASYQSAVASWRQGVLTAVKEVEQALVNLSAAQKRDGQAQLAFEQYRAYLQATEVDWKAGRASLLTLEVARRSALSSEIQYIDLQRDHLQYWIALYKALGGGWNAGDAVTPPQDNVATAGSAAERR